ncbi:MAG: LysR family transcriptional regulator [Pigmentiphaga sp.]|uniref:LysR family transcriptional regulator n=1 Tax=Pigmentiphaga sp. TaxID=1977564 RepID=UPI0029A0293A|nr:LysR family transcriptional regulator [Pigmentiphaga sp.]MDX3904841.1 LysR family transcriptional regulator [Pigmentiphaga sp.]
MELRHLRYFEAIAAAGNVTRAAAALHISQPSLSQAVKELEAELGMALLTRGPRGSLLTDAGREFARQASDILQRVPEAKAATRRAAQGAAGQLLLGFTGSSVFDVLPGMLQRAREVLPDLSVRMIEMLTDKQIEGLYARRIDVGVGRPLSGQPGLVSRVIAQRSFIAALHFRHPLARHREISLADLRDEPLITPQHRPGPGFHSHFLSMLSKAKLHLQVAHEATHMPTVLGLVAAGMGIGIVTDELRDLEVRDVIYRPLAEGKNAAQLALSWREDNDSQTLARFIALAGNSR